MLTKNQRRKIKVRQRVKLERKHENLTGRFFNLFKLDRAKAKIEQITAEHAEYQRVQNSMTNWQRNQYARAGYPEERIDFFASLVRGKA